MKKSFTPMAAALLTLGGLCFSPALQAQIQEEQPTPIEQLESRTQALEESVEKLRKLKVSGYIQAQFQAGQQEAVMNVGAKLNEDPGHSFNRFGIRRGRIKFAYEEGIFSGVFQLDITEKGLGIKDAYLSIKDPWVGANSLKAGVFDRPFGYEISYSSSRRESPERSRIFQTLFPGERDLGGMLTLQASKTSPWNFLKFEGGLFAGNGINQETDSRKDFIGHLSVAQNLGANVKLSGGFSYYNGGVYQVSANVYTMNGNVFVLNDDAANQGRYAKREYFGLDLQFALMSLLGMTHLRGEYLWGQQPAGPKSSLSPNASSLLVLSSVGELADTYLRPFSGYYVMLVQDLGKLPLSAVLKYDVYDPNTNVSGNAVGQADSKTSAVDLCTTTFGFGMLWRASNSIRLTAYYDVNTNEKTQNLPAFTKKVLSNIFTLRLQYKF